MKSLWRTGVSPFDESWVVDLTLSFSQVELRKTHTEVQPSAEPSVLLRRASLSKDTKPEGKQAVKLSGELTHGLSTQSEFIETLQHVTPSCSCFFQSRARPEFPTGLGTTGGFGKTWRLRRPRRRPRSRRCCSPCRRAGSRPGWSWPRGSRWPGATRPWTETESQRVWTARQDKTLHHLLMRLSSVQGCLCLSV